MNRIFLIITLLNAFCGTAQSISPSTINVGGGLTKTLDYSIGESTSINYLQSTNQISLSSGLLQSYTPLITGIVNQVLEEGEAFVLSPNPATNYVQLKGALSKPGFVELHLIDLQGRIMEYYPSTYYINYFEKEINTSHLQVGTYFLRLIYSSSDSIHQALSFKFSKIN